MVKMARDNERRTLRRNVFHASGSGLYATHGEDRRDRAHGLFNEKFAALGHKVSHLALSMRLTDRLKPTARLANVCSSTPAVPPSQRALQDPQSDGKVACRREPVVPWPCGVGARRANQNPDAECQQ